MSDKIEVTKEFIEKSMSMAVDLCDLAKLNKNKELSRDLMKRIKKCKKYIAKIEFAKNL